MRVGAPEQLHLIIMIPYWTTYVLSTDPVAPSTQTRSIYLSLLASGATTNEFTLLVR